MQSETLHTVESYDYAKTWIQPIGSYLAALCLCLTDSTCSIIKRGCTCDATFNTFSTASCQWKRNVVESQPHSNAWLRLSREQSYLSEVWEQARVLDQLNGWRQTSKAGLIVTKTHKAVIRERKNEKELEIAGKKLRVRTCEVFLCFVTIMFVLSIVLTSLFSLFYVCYAAKCNTDAKCNNNRRKM